MEISSSTSSSKNEFRATILWAVAIFVLVFCIDRVGAWGLSKLFLGTSSRHAELYRGGLQHDIVVVGNSRGVNGFFAPKISSVTGKSTFNISHNGMPACIVDTLVRDYVQMNESPKLVVIEISCVGSKERPSSIANYRPYLNFSERFETLFKDKVPVEYRRSQVSHLHRMSSELFFRSLAYLKRSDQNWINRRTINEAAIRRVEAGNPIELAMSKKQAELIGQLASDLNEQGIKVKLVLSPYLPQYLGKMTNLSDWIQQLEKYSGQEVFDYSGLPLIANGFADNVHLNPVGSELFLQKLIEDNVIPGGTSQ